MAAKQNTAMPGLPTQQNSGYSPLINEFSPDDFNALMNVVNDLSNEEIKTANPNIKGNPLYGYGNPALSWDGREYPYLPEWDERDVPENQDTLQWHLAQNGLYDQWGAIDNATPEQQEDITRMFTLLRNASDYSRQRNLDQFVEDQRQRNLYGDTLVDLLQNSPEGQSILNSIPAKNHPNRQRNITGSANPGSTDYWTLTGLEPANEALW